MTVHGLSTTARVAISADNPLQHRAILSLIYGERNLFGVSEYPKIEDI